MRLFVLALALSVSASASSAPGTPVPITIDPIVPPQINVAPELGLDGMKAINPDGPFNGRCPATSRYEAARRGGKLPPSLLTQLPNADMYNAVYRRIDGCQVPMVVRYDVGGSHR